MIQRGALILVALFWVAMNVLLWRAEYSARGQTGSPVPPKLVWRKILTAPDSSSLGVFHHGKKIGFCHWSTSVGEELNKVDDSADEGRVSKVAGYRLQLEGNLSVPDTGTRARFDGNLGLQSDESWQDLALRLNLKPALWEIRSVAAEKTVRLKIEEGEMTFQRSFKFRDLQTPGPLLEEFAGPGGLAMLGGLSFVDGFGLPAAQAWTFSPKWEARQDSVKIGHSLVRSYRLRTRLLGKYEIVIFASRVGEILRVELPDEVVLVNDQLGTP